VPLYRGGVYRGQSKDELWLLVGNNDWNEHFQDIPAVPLGSRGGFDALPPHSCTLELNGSPYVAVPSALASVSKAEDITQYVGTATQAELNCVEAALIDLLELRQLLSTNAHPLLLVGGSSHYPRWGEIYYGPPRGDAITWEKKRYVVVSDNSWNAVGPDVLCVRTTTSIRRSGPGFPSIQNGKAKACCGNIAAIRKVALDLRRRPSPPQSLSLRDMQSIAQGVADALGLSV
jgi:mRNA-degrading endonuclease toxin of MazEF toxin-antitoxin module